MSVVQISPPETMLHTVIRKRLSRKAAAASKQPSADAKWSGTSFNVGQSFVDNGIATQEASTTTSNFEFITFTGKAPATSHNATSKKVRSKAMRDYLQKQTRQAMTGVVEVVEGNNPEEPEQYKGKFKLTSWTHKTKEKALQARNQRLAVTKAKPARGEEDDVSEDTEIVSKRRFEVWQASRASTSVPSPKLSFLSGILDPFDTLCINLGPESEKLLVHYNTAYSMNSIAINAEGNFFSFVRTDPALFHAILYLVALHSDLRHGLADSPACLYHGSEAFRLINERLSGPDAVFSDATIAAVAMLVNKENLNGRYELSQMHMQGLERMVHMRGGVQNFQGVFRRIVTWSDFCYANVWSCQPSFPRLLPRALNQLASPDPDTKLLKPTHIFGSASPIVPIITALRDLSHSLSSDHISSINRMDASDTIYNLEYDLLLLNRARITDPEPTQCIYSFEAVPVKTAAHIFLWLVVRELPQTSQLLYRLVQRLQDSLAGQIPGWWSARDHEREMWLLWILWVGCVASPGRLEHFWFVGEMAELCLRMGIREKEELREALGRVVWQDDFCESRLETVWEDVWMVWDMQRQISDEA